MAEFYDILTNMTAWHWLILAAGLLVLEVLTGGTTYLLWPAAAAFALALLSFVLPLNWQIEWFLFALVTFILTIVGSLYLRPLLNKGGVADMNDRAAQLLEKTAETLSDFTNGRGRVRVDDTEWSATSSDGSDLKAGQKVVIDAVNGTILSVSAAALAPKG